MLCITISDYDITFLCCRAHILSAAVDFPFTLKIEILKENKV